MNIVKCTLLLWGTMLLFSAHSAEYRVIMTGKDEKTEAGFVGNNMYSDVAVLNPSVHRSAVKLEEFGLYMPSKDSDNRDTYDEEKARIRLFFKPSVRAKTARGRRVYLVLVSIKILPSPLLPIKAVTIALLNLLRSFRFCAIKSWC